MLNFVLGFKRSLHFALSTFTDYRHIHTTDIRSNSFVHVRIYDVGVLFDQKAMAMFLIHDFCRFGGKKY